MTGHRPHARVEDEMVPHTVITLLRSDNLNTGPIID
jgi:hypothetical protein